jgi:hypothetical protein
LAPRQELERARPARVAARDGPRDPLLVEGGAARRRPADPDAVELDDGGDAPAVERMEREARARAAWVDSPFAEGGRALVVVHRLEVDPAPAELVREARLVEDGVAEAVEDRLAVEELGAAREVVVMAEHDVRAGLDGGAP